MTDATLPTVYIVIARELDEPAELWDERFTSIEDAAEAVIARMHTLWSEADGGEFPADDVWSAINAEDGGNIAFGDDDNYNIHAIRFPKES